MLRATADSRLSSSCLELLRAEDNSEVEELVRDGIRICWKELFVRGRAAEEVAAGPETLAPESAYGEHDEPEISAGDAAACGYGGSRESDHPLRPQPHEAWAVELDDDFW